MPLDTPACDAPPLKNQDGHLGPICGYCGGYGFTNSLKSGESSGCRRCNGGGVEPPDLFQLQKDVDTLRGQVADILRRLSA